MSQRKEWSSHRRLRRSTPERDPLLFRLESISPLGLVFHCERPCEEGTAMALGVRVQLTGKSSADMALEGTVVDCRPLSRSGSGAGVYRVTLLFHSLTEAQKETLAHAADRFFPGGPFTAPAAFPVETLHAGMDGFPSVCGLN